MSDVLLALSRLKRPALLLSAARHAATAYDRDRDLARVLGKSDGLAPHGALEYLLDEEAQLNETRRRGGAGYSAPRHI